MRTFCYYHNGTGNLHTTRVTVSMDDDRRAWGAAYGSCPTGHSPIEGSWWDPQYHRMNLQTMQMEGFSAAAPTPLHAWDPQSMRWTMGPEWQAARDAKQQIAVLMTVDHPRLLRAVALGRLGALALLSQLDTRLATLQAAIDAFTTLKTQNNLQDNDVPL